LGDGQFAKSGVTEPSAASWPNWGTASLVLTTTALSATDQLLVKRSPGTDASELELLSTAQLACNPSTLPSNVAEPVVEMSFDVASIDVIIAICSRILSIRAFLASNSCFSPFTTTSLSVSPAAGATALGTSARLPTLTVPVEVTERGAAATRGVSAMRPVLGGERFVAAVAVRIERIEERGDFMGESLEAVAGERPFDGVPVVLMMAR